MKEEHQDEDSIADVDLAIVVGIRRIVAGQCRLTKETVREQEDPIGDVDRAQPIGISPSEDGTSRAWRQGDIHDPEARGPVAHEDSIRSQARIDAKGALEDRSGICRIGIKGPDKLPRIQPSPRPRRTSPAPATVAAAGSDTIPTRWCRVVWT